MRFHSIFFTALLLFSATSRSQVVINEIMAANATVLIETDYYNFPDWVEIYNKGTTGVNLSDYYLSDDPDALKKWRFPSVVLGTDQYYLVYCDKEGTGTHTTFGLSADGETIYLSNNSGIVIDQVTYYRQFPDISYGRNPADMNKWLYCSTPTPGKVNSTTTATEQVPGTSYSVPAGRLNASTSLELEGTGIKYTINGSDPDPTSLSYSQPLKINKTMVVKTITYQDGYLPGETYANTYFLGEHNFTLPVVVLSFTPDYFYDDIIGIHVRGTNGTEGNCAGTIANWNQNWERAAYLEYFDAEGVKQISQPIGVKLAGGCTRGRPQKSLSLYARSKYGNNDFDYAVFKQKPEINSYKSLLLRNSGNDQDQTLLRDAFLQALVNQSMDLDFQSYQPAIVYFNDEYRGIMNLREKTDEDYFISNYALSSDEIDFIEGILFCETEDCYATVRGSADDYYNLISYVSFNSLTDDAKYAFVTSQLDLQEYINYMTLQIYIANTDWPGNNLKIWKKSVNGRWRWMVFDLDYAFGFRLDPPTYTHETFDFATAPDGDNHPNPPWSTLLFRKLLENEGFKKQFLSTYVAHMYSSFSPEWCNYVLDSLSGRIDYEILYNQIKYGRTKEQWLQYLDVLRKYAANRSNFMPAYVKSFFSLSSDNANVTITNPDLRKGKVDVNHAVIQMYPLNMTTYRELPLHIRAIPEKGYRFVQWNHSDQSTLYSEEIEIVSDTSFNLSIEPVFEPLYLTEGIFLNEVAPVSSLFRDEFDEKSGFVEIYNNNNEDKTLFSFFLSDDKDNLLRYALPDSTVIPAHGFLFYFLDGEARQSVKHTSFKADTDGESIYLSQKSGSDMHIFDSVSFSQLFFNHSFGKYFDGTGDWLHMANMTPGSPNDPAELVPVREIIEFSLDLSIFPNPSDGNVCVSINESNMASNLYSMDVIDICGKVLYPQVWINSSRNYINLTKLDDGLFFVRLYKNQRLISTCKLIILK
ncbi:MAG: CotH kinase family protein [Bacteroidales bacterium]|nr:CotH kinase family protein [Bacteroidales bacterium]